jgi:hypothetical protein
LALSLELGAVVAQDPSSSGSATDARLTPAGAGDNGREHSWKGALENLCSYSKFMATNAVPKFDNG